MSFILCLNEKKCSRYEKNKFRFYLLHKMSDRLRITAYVMLEFLY